MENSTTSEGDDRASSANRRRVGLLGTGALLAVGFALVRGPSVDGESWPDHPAGPIALWAADRDGHAVYGLDEDMIIARRVRFEWPVAVAACPDGGVWILRSSDGTPVGPSRLVRIDADGAISSETELTRCADLAALEDGSALVLEKGMQVDDPDQVLRIGETGDWEALHRGKALTCLATSGQWIWIGAADGRLLRVSLANGRVAAESVVMEGSILEIEAGPAAADLWVLEGEDRTRIHLVDADLHIRWTADVGAGASSIAAVPGEERVWVVDGARAVARRLGEGGIVEIENGDLSVKGLGRSVCSLGGDVALAAPGCILRLDSAGRMRPGQGGFAYLVDLDRVQPRRPRIKPRTRSRWARVRGGERVARERSRSGRARPRRPRSRERDRSDRGRGRFARICAAFVEVSSFRAGRANPCALSSPPAT